MLIPFFYLLRDGGMKTSITELLTLLEAMRKGVAGQSVDDFYYLSRACLVKDESQLDRFDRIFAAYFKGVEDTFSDFMTDVPEEWLRHQAELMLSAEERAQIEALGCSATTHERSLREGSRKRTRQSRGRMATGGRDASSPSIRLFLALRPAGARPARFARTRGR